MILPVSCNNWMQLFNPLHSPKSPKRPAWPTPPRAVTAQLRPSIPVDKAAVVSSNIWYDEQRQRNKAKPSIGLLLINKKPSICLLLIIIFSNYNFIIYYFIILLLFYYILFYYFIIYYYNFLKAIHLPLAY